jgi:hypothetical protein
MKFLLCRPRGGLNDSLYQIERCFRYAERYQRYLVIDTEYLVSTGISVNFSKIFKLAYSSDRVFFQMTPELIGYLNSRSTYPPACKGRLDRYQTQLDDRYMFIDIFSGSQLTFNFNQNYSEEVLIHDQLGGGKEGVCCLERLKLTGPFRNDVISLLQPLLGQRHIGLHVRNTDFLTNFKSFFEDVYQQSINQRILVCSDDLKVIEFAKEFFNQSNIIHLSTPPHTDDYSIPTFATYHCTVEQRYQLMVSLFADLIGLATSSQLILSPLQSGEFSESSSKHKDFVTFARTIKANPTLKIGIDGVSGFGYLAQSLKASPKIISQLFSS